MPKLKVLAGKDLLAFLTLHGFSIASQKGSHIKLLRVEGGKRQILTVPNHSELDRGTAHALYRQASVYIAESLLREFFFTK